MVKHVVVPTEETFRYHKSIDGYDSTEAFLPFFGIDMLTSSRLDVLHM